MKPHHHTPFDTFARYHHHQQLISTIRHLSLSLCAVFISELPEKGDDATSPPPPSLVTITTIAISPIPNRSSPPPLLVEHTGPRGMTLPKLCPNVCKVVVVTREQELVLCRGDVWNSSPSRLTRMLQSLTGIAKCSL
ncbi:hypothetical protein Bca4012_042763 [Brassica carinata]